METCINVVGKNYDTYAFLEVVTDQPEQPTQDSSQAGDELIVELGGSLKLKVCNDHQVDLAAKLIKSLNQ